MVDLVVLVSWWRWLSWWRCGEAEVGGGDAEVVEVVLVELVEMEVLGGGGEAVELWNWWCWSRMRCWSLWR